MSNFWTTRPKIIIDGEDMDVILYPSDARDTIQAFNNLPYNDVAANAFNVTLDIIYVGWQLSNYHNQPLTLRMSGNRVAIRDPEGVIGVELGSAWINAYFYLADIPLRVTKAPRVAPIYDDIQGWVNTMHNAVQIENPFGAFSLPTRFLSAPVQLNWLLEQLP